MKRPRRGLGGVTRVSRRLGLVVAMVLVASLAAMPVYAGGGPIANGAVQTANGFQVQFVIFEDGGVVNFAFTAPGIVGGFEATECVYQEGNKLWAVGPETLHAGVFQGAPFEGSEYIMLAIEDNSGTGEPDLRDVYFSDPPFNEFDAKVFCGSPELFSANYPAGTGPQHVVVHGDIRIRQ
jgi:hypothetical protein